MTNAPHDPPLPDEIDALLPWYATGRLSPADKERVDAALAADPDLAMRVARVEEERIETLALVEALGAPSSRAREDLFARIAAQAPPPPRPTGFGLRPGEILAALSPRALAWAAGVAVLTILLQAGLLTTLALRHGPGGTYVTASHPGETAAGDGAFALVAFAPDATAAAITAFLDANHASIVDGPHAGGVFRVRLAPTRLPPGELDRAIARLQQDTRIVRFIVPAP